MARSVAAKFEMFYSVDFETVIRGHHIYKSAWKPCDGEMLNCVKDKRDEAMEYDKNAICVYRTPSESEQKMLVGHVPIELSSLMNNFLKANDSNKLVAKVSGKRKREVCLVVPAKFKALKKEYRLSKILDEQLQARKEKYTHFEIVHVEKSFKNFPVMY